MRRLNFPGVGIIVEGRRTTVVPSSFIFLHRIHRVESQGDITIDLQLVGPKGGSF